MAAARVSQQKAEAALKAAKKSVRQAEMNSEHAKKCLEELRKAHASCEVRLHCVSKSDVAMAKS